MTEPIDNERDAELVAYLDGELDEQSARAIETQMQTDATLRERVDGLKRTWDLLDYLPQPEPSLTFTSRTLERATAIRPAEARPTSSTPIGVQSPTTSFVNQPEWTWRKWTVVIVVALLLFAAGFLAPGPLLNREPRPLSPAEAERQMARDLRVLNNLSLYRYGDDMSFVYNLDHPDLFGEEAGNR
jgi:anti-sigma factor RsiW